MVARVMVAWFGHEEAFAGVRKRRSGKKVASGSLTRSGVPKVAWRGYAGVWSRGGGRIDCGFAPQGGLAMVVVPLKQRFGRVGSQEV